MYPGCHDLHWWFAGNFKCFRSVAGGMDDHRSCEGRKQPDRAGSYAGVGYPGRKVSDDSLAGGHGFYVHL